MRAVLKSRKFGFIEEITIPRFIPVIRIPLPKELTFPLTGDDSDLRNPSLQLIDFQFVKQSHDGTCFYEEHELEREK